MTERPSPGVTWTGTVRPEDDAAVRLYSAAADAIRFFGQGWTRNTPRCALDEYEPSVVRFHLHHWNELSSLSEATSSPGAEPIGTAGEVDARRTLIAIKTDLECGTDTGLAGILHWQQVARIYKLQLRWSVYLDKRAAFDHRNPNRESEPWKPLAEAICVERIARQLGWRPHEFCEAA